MYFDAAIAKGEMFTTRADRHGPARTITQTKAQLISRKGIQFDWRKDNKDKWSEMNLADLNNDGGTSENR